MTALSQIAKRAGGWTNATPGPMGEAETQRQRQRRRLREQAAKTGKTQKQVRQERAANRASQMAGKQSPIDEKIARMTTRKPSPLYRLAGKKIPGGRLTVGTGLTLGGIGAGWGLASKSDNRDRATAAAVGGAGTYGLYRGGSYAANMTTRNAGRKDPVSNKLMGLHRKKHGLPTGPLADVRRHGTKAQKQAVDDFYRTIPHGVKFSGTRRLLARTYGAGAHGRMAIPVAVAGGAGGLTFRERKAQQKRQSPVMKSEEIVKGTNIREYEHLPEDIRQQVGYGSIGIRRNPLSPLDMFAASRTMSEAASRARGERISRRKLNRRAHQEMTFAGSRAMLYSPVGRGSVF